MIELHSASTPNGWKISIALEELGLPYEVHRVDLLAQEQKQPRFLAMNPNGRIPVIVDRSREPAFTVFESGAILVYLAERTGRLLPADPEGRSRTLQWLMLQVSGIGPMHGQAGVFLRYFPERLPSVISRYRNETLRLYRVLDAQLATHEYLAGEYGIADIACFPWVSSASWIDLDLSELVHLTRWQAAIAARPAVQRGLAMPPPMDPAAMLERGPALLTR